MSASDWTSLAVALATFILAFIAAITLIFTKRATQATARLANEAVTDRELVWQPVLSLLSHVPVQQKPVPAGFPYASLTIRNAGGGPALATRVLIVYGNLEWSLIAPVDVLAGQDMEGIPLILQRGQYPKELIGEVSPVPNVTGIAAIFCRDILERWYRFAISITDSGFPKHPPQIWKSGSGTDVPAWVSSKLLWDVE